MQVLTRLKETFSADRTLSKETAKLIALVEKRASDAFSAKDAQQLLDEGADITVRVKDQTMSMIACVKEEIRRSEAAGLFRTQYCAGLAEVLRDHASDLLGRIVLSTEDPDFEKMESLAAIEASYYQETKYGALGLLGHLLQQQDIPIRDDVVRFLIQNDPKVRYSLTLADEQNETCLSLANKNGKCPQKVRENLQKALNTLLVRAAFDHPDVEASEITRWIARGADIEAVDDQENTALTNAIKQDDYGLVCVLVAAGCDVNREGPDGKRPVQLAKEMTKRNARLIALLETVNPHADLKRLIETKRSRLTVHAVAEKLAQGASINAPIANNSTFLHLLIANHGSPELLAAFINDFNADLFAMDMDGHRSIEMCILHDPRPCHLLQTLLKLPKVNTDLFFNPRLNKSILEFAQERDNSEAVKIIQADLNLRLWNVVLRATTKDESNQRLESEVKLLVKHKAKVDHKHTEKDYDRWTVLHLACKTATKSFVQFLIQECRADPNLATGQGDLPVSIAAEFGHQPMIEYFNEQLGLSLNVSNKEKQTPMHFAARSGHFNVVRYLVRWGADHRAKNSAGQSPLDLARSNASQAGPNLVERKSLLLFLERLKCPSIGQRDPNERATVVPSDDLDVCELPESPQMKPIEAKEEKASKTKGFFSKGPNDMLHDAAIAGRADDMEAAIQQGADICWKRNEMSAYKIALLSMEDYKRKASAVGANVTDVHRYQSMCIGCQKIMERLQQLARSALTEAIKNSDAREAIAYLDAGAPVTADLLYFVCTTTDDIQILNYLTKHYVELRQVLIEYTTADSPYRLAKQCKHLATASFIKYTLSVECTTAVAANNVDYVRKLIRAGASPDMPSVSNLDVALAHQSPELVRVLCDAGARMREEWFQPKSISLPPDVVEQLHPDIAFQMNRSFLNRQLRHAAAAGDWEMFDECIRHGADINAENSHGSTALLCSIQHGNHFRIVHALLSRGATILHSNLNEPISLVDLAQKYHFTQIAEYMSKELNRQFLTSILNNDQKSAERFEALGADFNCQDEQGRTPLHYAVRYHGVELASWLTDRGSTPMRPDQEGTFPIHEAVQKGDYAVAELLMKKYPTIRQQQNKIGQNALQLAQKNGFSRIAYLFEHGVAPPPSLEDDPNKSSGAKYTVEELEQATRIGQMQVIREFCEEPYDSREEKLEICAALIPLAKQFKQQEVLDALKVYYQKELTARSTSNYEDDLVRLKKDHQVMLKSFLTGLGQTIADSPQTLDPSDPKTYIQFFSSITANVQQRAEELANVVNVKDIDRVSKKDLEDVNQKLGTINSYMKNLKKEKNKVAKLLEEYEEQLFKQRELSAVDRKRIHEMREDCKKQLVTYECSAALQERNRESVLNRGNILEFIRKEPNMYLFYRTIEIRLQSLFVAVLTAQGGYLTTLMQSKSGSSSNAGNSVPTATDILPSANALLKGIQKIFSPSLSKLNAYDQKLEFQNISNFGNIEELNRIASDTAGMLTLYYREQITMIDTSQLIPSHQADNGTLGWLKSDSIGARAKNNSELSVVVVADYIIGWLLTALKAGKNQIRPYAPIPQQLWLFVAKYNPMEANRLSNKSGSAGAGEGQLKVGLKKTKKQVPIRYLIGCASMVGNEGEISQVDVRKYNIDQEFSNLEMFGYVYVTPFSQDPEVFEEIIEGRKLVPAKHDNHGNMFTRVDDIVELAKVYQSEADDYGGKGGVSMEMAEQVAKILLEKRYFLDANGVREEVEKSKMDITYDVNVLREDIEKKTTYYQTTFEAAREQLQNDSIQALDKLRKTSDKLFSRSVKELSDQTKTMEGSLEKKIDQRLTQIDQQMERKSVEIQKIVDQSRNQSTKARQQATEANQASQRAAEQAVQALSDVKTAGQNLDQAQQDFERKAEKCQTDVQQAITQSTVTFEKTITEVRQKVENNAQRTKEAAERAAAEVKDSSRSAKESTEVTRKLDKTIREQIEGHKKETDRLLEEVKEIRKQNTRLVEEARKGTQQAKEAAEQSMQARSDVKTAAKNLEQARLDFKRKVEKGETDVQQASGKTTAAFDKTVSEVRPKIESNTVRRKEATGQAKGSSHSSKESADPTQRVDKTSREKGQPEKLVEEGKKQNVVLREETREAF